MCDCYDITLLTQIASAVGQCVSALIAVIAVVAAFITIRRMQEQTRIAAYSVGLSQIICQIEFGDKAPSNGKSLFPTNIESLSQREQLKQLHDVLKRWKSAKTSQLPQHKFLIFTIKTDGSNTGAVSPVNVHLKVKIRIPPQPGKNYISKRDAFTVPISIAILKSPEIYYVPLDNVLACDVEAKGSYQFTGQLHKIEVVGEKFDDYDAAFGVTPIAGGENATSA